MRFLLCNIDDKKRRIQTYQMFAVLKNLPKSNFVLDICFAALHKHIFNNVLWTFEKQTKNIKRFFLNDDFDLQNTVRKNVTCLECFYNVNLLAGMLIISM